MQERIRSMLNDPLAHFLLVAAAVFVLFEAVATEGAGLGDDVIVVDRDALLTHLQYRTRTFDPTIAEQRLAALTDVEREKLAHEYVREEALYREALALGLDANDYIIKRRLIQKVEFLAEGFAEARFEIGDDELIAQLEANRADYFVEPKATFTHVFFSAEQRGRAAALSVAAETLGALDGVAFNDAGRFGDRFRYHRNYVEQNERLVDSHFGEAFARRVFASPAGDGDWRGPWESPHGAHLVLVTRVEAGRDPDFEEIRSRLEQDVRSIRSQERLGAAIDEIVAGYEVVRAD